VRDIAILAAAIAVMAESLPQSIRRKMASSTA